MWVFGSLESRIIGLRMSREFDKVSLTAEVRAIGDVLVTLAQ